MIPKDQNDISSIIPTEHRCRCGKLLFKGLIASSELEIKCKNCHVINVIGRDYSKPENNLRYSILFNLDGRIVDASDSATQILGHSKEELASMKIQEIFPLLKISTYAHLSKVSTFFDIEPFHWDTLHQNKHGQFTLARVNLTYVKDNTKTHTLAMFECLQKPDESIDHSKINNSHRNHCKFISRINAEGIYTYVSMELATLLGYSSIEMLGTPITDFFEGKEREKIQEIFSQNIISKESFKVFPHKIISKNKDIINFESHFASDFNDRNTFRGFQIMSWLVS